MKLNAWDRFTMTIAPRWTLERVRARAAAEAFSRGYDAATPGRRTKGWARTAADVNAITARAGSELRLHARDLVRNNAWAKRAVNVIANNSIGFGIVPRATGNERETAAALWRDWADTTACDADGRKTFAALQWQALAQCVIAGEVLIRRRIRRPEDGLTVPLQVQILEPEFLDTAKEEIRGAAGGPIIQGVEFDAIGRRAAYWLFERHPGSTMPGNVSRRVPASEILHLFLEDRPGQVRGLSWLAASIVNLKDLDEYEDAELMKQKIAACFAGFVTDMDGGASPLGERDTTIDNVETLEPGMIQRLAPGKTIEFATPPQVVNDGFAVRNLRRIAAGLGVTYEDMTGDFSQVNFSSARMGRLVHQGFVRRWQWDLIVPLLCAPVWRWFVDAAILADELGGPVGAEWTCPPLPLIEPDREIRASTLAVRSGFMTPSEVVREAGGDPESHWLAYAADMKRLDELKIRLDSDPRATSQAGLTQERVGGGGGGGAPPAAGGNNGAE